MTNLSQPKINELISSFSRGAYIRSVNFHNTPHFRLKDYEKQLAFYGEYFEPVSVKDLDTSFESNRWKKNKPGLIINFFNGYRNNFDVFYPLLEKYGFIGWFFVATDFLNIPNEKQKDYAQAHTLGLVQNEYTDSRYSLSWDEVRELSKRHIIASHTKTHSELMTSSTDEEMKREIIESKRELELQIQNEVPAFAWLGGKEYSGNPTASKYLKQAGYRYLFSNLKIEKIKKGV
jgi:peptidoglycan/xylan/chitin deacetylase (PgdA/CDA1 family)